MTEHRINIMQDEVPAVQAQQPQEQKVTYASVSERFVALLIDYGVIFISCRFVVWLWDKIAHPELTAWQALALIGCINALFVRGLFFVRRPHDIGQSARGNCGCEKRFKRVYFLWPCVVPRDWLLHQRCVTYVWFFASFF